MKILLFSFEEGELIYTHAQWHMERGPGRRAGWTHTPVHGGLCRWWGPEAGGVGREVSDLSIGQIRWRINENINRRRAMPLVDEVKQRSCDRQVANCHPFQPNSQFFIAGESAQLANFMTSTFCNVPLAVSSIPAAFPPPLTPKSGL